MSMKTLKAGEILYRTEEALAGIDLLMKGSVRVTYPHGEMTLEKGDAIGIMDSCGDAYTFTYTAATDSAILHYPYQGPDSLCDLLRSNKDLPVLFASSMTRQICQMLDHMVFTHFESENLYHFILESYEDYKTLCTNYAFPVKTLPDFDEMEPVEEDILLPAWMIGYYDNIRNLPIPDFRILFQKNIEFTAGYLLKASQDIHTALLACEEFDNYNQNIVHLLLNENHLDFFDLYTELYCKTAGREEFDSSLIATISKLMIYLEGLSSIDSSYYEKRTEEYQKQVRAIELRRQQSETASTSDPLTHDSSESRRDDLSGSLDIILSFANCPEETTEAFRRQVGLYVEIPDKSSSEESFVSLQKSLTSLFYQIYRYAFEASLSASYIPDAVKMFFCFGYVDENLTGTENAMFLLSQVKKMDFSLLPAHGVYTMYGWLRAIYEGRKEPSRNEFDMDYTAYVHDMKISNKIDAAGEAKLLQDCWEKVLFELQNMFPLVNKMSFGRITNYCPLLSEHNILKSLDNTFLSEDTVREALNSIRRSDYSAFCRESIYVNQDIDITKETLQLEILPDIILLPSVGTRGIMWQEIEGKRRSTPARMMLPILSMTDINMTLMRMTAEFRWEMCKRIQGSRWNDVSERSLTSDYCDYIQFYRKNHDLSADTKEKIKLALVRARNSFKECFIQDYMDYMLYEAKGSPRLNKAARNILFSYCPFTVEICERLQSNPLFSEVLNRRQIKQGQLLHRHQLLVRKIESSGREVPLEIANQEAYIKGTALPAE